jgi:hypothetical protein
VATTDGTNTYRAFRAFIPECARHDIGKTTAYALANEGMLETFLIGSKRYVYLDSIATLPERLARRDTAANAA